MLQTFKLHIKVSHEPRVEKQDLVRGRQACWLSVSLDEAPLYPLARIVLSYSNLRQAHSICSDVSVRTPTTPASHHSRHQFHRELHQHQSCQGLFSHTLV